MARREYRALLRGKRESFWQSKVELEKSTPRQLWRSIDALLGQGRVPPTDDDDTETLNQFFVEKVAGVRSLTDDAAPPVFRQPSTMQTFH